MNFTGGRVYFTYSSEMWPNKRSWTMETWAKGNATANASRCIICAQASAAGSNGTMALLKNTANKFYVNMVGASGTSYTAVDATTSAIYSNWNHVVGQRWGNTLFLHVNGVMAARTEIVNAQAVLNNTVNKFAVGGDGEYNQSSGGYGGAYGDRWPGWLQDFRQIIGKAIYTDQPFTPPSAPLTISY
jgi:hypothetical protein